MSQLRVGEGAVAHILSLIADPPQLRTQPQAGDLSGDFDRWFDGGALRYVTGSTQYLFADGTRASVAVMPTLVISITFASGERVGIVQEREPA
jgi:hypothetical protein